jgi:2-oxo-3-hexenedioate decarboxylase
MSVAVDVCALAEELRAASGGTQIIDTPPSGRIPGFDLDAGYSVEAELVRMRRASGRTTVGRKVGYANKAVWRALKLETLVWAHMYDDTVTYAVDTAASLDIARMHAPKIEPEIVFKLRAPLAAGADAVQVLGAVEWLALGFEIIDCPFAGWTFQPADFVAAFGLHAALVVGDPRPIDSTTAPLLVEQLAQFTVRLTKNGEAVAEGSGKNSLRSPALCLAELASAIARRMPDEPLAAGELVSSGTLTESQPIAAGESWTATADGIDLPPLNLSIR